MKRITVRMSGPGWRHVVFAFKQLRSRGYSASADLFLADALAAGAEVLRRRRYGGDDPDDQTPWDPED